MTKLAQQIRDAIRRDGPMTVGRYMETVLGDPAHGYYPTRDPLGAAGDFVTAPEISQLFGELVGLWCAVTWRQMGAPVPVRLIELGPGRGTLMADALRAARTVPSFADAIQIHLVDTSPVLRARQRAALDGVATRPVNWHDNLAGVAPGPALIVANEFLDALPVDQYLRTADGWRQLHVAIDAATGRLVFDHGEETATPPPGLPSALRDARPGSLCEAGPVRLEAVRDIARRIAGDGGAALIVDYGPAESGAGDSLQAVRRHRFHDPLDDPGAADLTAHVDFAAVAAAASDAGVQIHGPLPQGEFLSRLGIFTRAQRLMAAADAETAREIAAGCERLTDPGAMGTLFKVLALSQPGWPAPAGFEPEAEDGC